MDEKAVLYKLTVNFPISEETTKLYSEDDELMVVSLQEAMHKIETIIRKDGFISLERIARILGFRASPTCPHILFDDLSDYRFDGEWLDLELECDFLVTPYEISAKDRPKKKLYIVPEEEKEEENKEEEVWKPSSPKETSESAESDKT